MVIQFLHAALLTSTKFLCQIWGNKSYAKKLKPFFFPYDDDGNYDDNNIQDKWDKTRAIRQLDKQKRPFLSMKP